MDDSDSGLLNCLSGQGFISLPEKSLTTFVGRSTSAI